MQTIDERTDQRQQERDELRRAARYVLEQVEKRTQAPPAVPLDDELLSMVALFAEATLEHVNACALVEHTATDPHELEPANDTDVAAVVVPPHDPVPAVHVWTCPACLKAHTCAGAT